MAVQIWEEDVIIPTYEVGAPDKNPMFLEKRVYQGSSGKVYPYPVTQTISSEKTDKHYRAVYLENEYLKIMFLPELGGRVQRAFDKTNGYDFVYYNRVIKPALVGLCGPWISGGIEFNWPQHHRPTTFMPVDHLLRQNPDGSCSLLVGDVDQMYGTKSMASFTLYPGKAYLEIKGQLYNGTALPQTFLWWANPAVSVNDDTQSIFPPDVHHVFDHGKRAVSTFPIATGEYYKHDYSAGVDISRYKNIPVPTSYMAETSRYDFIGGYDYRREAGLLHVADHHISPGKKQWTWGCGDFGKAWDRNLTDADGPYIELMTGVYTENQPDFSWLQPFEEKTFVQYFMPYKKVGAISNATQQAAIGVKVTGEQSHVVVYATGEYPEAEIVVQRDGVECFRQRTALSPVQVFDRWICIGSDHPQELTFLVLSQGETLVSYTPEKEQPSTDMSPAKPARQPQQIATNEQLLLTAQHIEQHRHATYLPDPYYLEGLRRDPGDIRINNAYGMLLLRRGCFAEAEACFRRAVARMTWRSPNPYDSEGYYNLGLSLLWQDREQEAYDAFYKATWSSAQQETSYYYLAVIAARRHLWAQALGFVEKGLVKNAHNVKARGLKAALLRHLGNLEEAKEAVADNLRLDPFDYLSRYEGYLLCKDTQQLEQMNRLMRGAPQHYLDVSRAYGEAGMYREGVDVLSVCPTSHPMLAYYQGYWMGKMGDLEGELAAYQSAQRCCPDCCFPNQLEDIGVLKRAGTVDSCASKSFYYLGCLFYDKLQFDTAIALWEKSIALDGSFPTAHRNLAIALYNKKGDAAGALRELETAFALDPTDARIFLERDALYKRTGMGLEKRLSQFERYRDLVLERDDAMLEWVTLYNLTGRHQQALDTILAHHFRPWEGGEGKISGQYKLALRALAGECMRQGDLKKAAQLLQTALVYPECLGEGRLEGTKDNDIHYGLGVVWEALGDRQQAEDAFRLALSGSTEPAGVQYYYDQPAGMIFYQGLAWRKLGQLQQSQECLERLYRYGKAHLEDVMQPDFFAVSLPDFLIFEDDIQQKNKAHCWYLMGLSALGQGDRIKAKECFERSLSFDPTYQDSQIYHIICEKEGEPL